MVEPPPAESLPVTLPSAARTNPVKEKPEFVQKSRSSAASTAFSTWSGISSKLTWVRLPSGGTMRAICVLLSEAYIVEIWLLARSSGSGTSYFIYAYAKIAHGLAMKIATIINTIHGQRRVPFFRLLPEDGVVSFLSLT